MKIWRNPLALGMVGLVVTAACGSDSKPTAPTPVADPHLTAPVPLSPSDGEQLSTLRPTFTLQNGTSDQTGERTYEFQISDDPAFPPSTASPVIGYFVVVNKGGVPEGADGRTSFTIDQDLQPTTRFYWRARMTQGNGKSEWTATRKFNSRLVGFVRNGELYDPLIHGETVGTRVGSTNFVLGKGIRINTSTSHVTYRLPKAIPTGEFSMEVEGLRANAPGGKNKVFGMQEGTTDFITNHYRVDAQYRGASASPPNCIQWRAMFDGEKLEPTTATRYASVYRLDPSRTYYWKGTWTNRGFRLQVLDGGMNGSTLYDESVTEDSVHYNPNPHYAYLGAPVGRSGVEAASVPGAIYRNVWIGNRPRPASLGSALEEIR